MVFFGKLLKSYCEDTSLHGFKYITKDEVSIIERVVWVVATAAGLTFCFYLCHVVYGRYRHTPTITTVESTHYPISNVFFPAVTFCNINKIQNSKAHQFADSLNFSQGVNKSQVLKFLMELTDLIYPEDLSFEANTAVPEVIRANNYTMEDVMRLLVQPCDELLVRCKWKSKLFNCTERFKVTKTTEGFCCSFNYLAQVGDTDSNNGGEFAKPQRLTGSGMHVGLTLLLDLQVEEYFATLFSFPGLKVFLHYPYDFPETMAVEKFIAPKKEVFLAVVPSTTYSPPQLKELSVEQRNCWFDDEKKLRTTSVYSYATCITECKMDEFQRICNCIPFYYSKNRNDNVCTLEHVPCLAKNVYSFRHFASTHSDADEAERQGMHCDCFPPCSYMSYSVDSDINDFTQSPYDRAEILDGINLKNHAMVHVFYRDISVIKYRRDAIITWDNLMASFGGIFGLCLGGSLLSLFELPYFFFLRLVSFLKRRKRKKQMVIPATILGEYKATLCKRRQANLDQTCIR